MNISKSFKDIEHELQNPVPCLLSLNIPHCLTQTECCKLIHVL